MTTEIDIYDPRHPRWGPWQPASGLANGRWRVVKTCLEAPTVRELETSNGRRWTCKNYVSARTKADELNQRAP